MVILILCSTSLTHCIKQKQKKDPVVEALILEQLEVLRGPGASRSSHGDSTRLTVLRYLHHGVPARLIRSKTDVAELTIYKWKKILREAGHNLPATKPNNWGEFASAGLF
jgi:hypothetical protein